MRSSNTTRRRRHVGALLALVSALSVIVLAAPASASPPTQQELILATCGGGVGCGWEDPDFKGDRYFAATINSCVNRRCEIDWWNGDNEISSVANNTNCTLRLYSHDQWQGAIYEIPPYKAHTSLPGYDNMAESFAFICPR